MRNEDARIGYAMALSDIMETAVDELMVMDLPEDAVEEVKALREHRDRLETALMRVVE